MSRKGRLSSCIMGQYSVSNVANRPGCPRCDSSHVVRNGTRRNHILYLCRGCGRQFRSPGALHGLRFPPDLIGEAVERYYRRASLQRVAAELGRDRGCPGLSRKTVSRWVQTFSAAAVRQVADQTAQPTPCWLGVSLATRIRGSGCWMWFIVDLPARYVLACHLSVDRNADAARQVLEKALDRAAGAPSPIATDDVELWRAAVASVLDDGWASFVEDLRGNRLPEGLEGTLRSQAARVRRLWGLDQGLSTWKDGLSSTTTWAGMRSPGGRPPGSWQGWSRPVRHGLTWLGAVPEGRVADLNAHSTTLFPFPCPGGSPSLYRLP